MIDIDDFKRVNDVHGHGVGDELLKLLADAVRGAVRPEDIVCRLGGEEFGVIMSACDGTDATHVAGRIVERLEEHRSAPGVGKVTVSVGIALGPEHAMNPRELAACAEAAMMTAKAHGKNRVVLYDEGETERPDAPMIVRDVRSLAHMKMLQSLTGQAQPADRRAPDRRRDHVGAAVAHRLPQLPRIRRRRGRARSGRIPRRARRRHRCAADGAAADPIGVGVTGQCAERAESLLIGDAANCEFGHRIERDTPVIEESIVAVPLRYGSGSPASSSSRSSASTSSTRTTCACSRCSRATPRSRSRTRACTTRRAARPKAPPRCSSSAASWRLRRSLDYILQRVVELTSATARLAAHVDLARGRDGCVARARCTGTRRRSGRTCRARRYRRREGRRQLPRTQSRSSYRRRDRRRSSTTRSISRRRTRSRRSTSTGGSRSSSPRSPRRSCTASASCGCSAGSRTRRSSRSRTRAATRGSSARS